MGVSTSPRILAVLSICALWLTGCAINPATGKRQFVLISERQEIEIGRENDRAITSQMGLYDDDALQEYVQTLGRKLASPRNRSIILASILNPCARFTRKCSL